MNVAKVEKMTGRFNASLKPMPSAGPFPEWVSQMTPSSNWPMLKSFQRTSGKDLGCGYLSYINSKPPKSGGFTYQIIKPIIKI